MSYDEPVVIDEALGDRFRDWLATRAELAARDETGPPPAPSERHHSDDSAADLIRELATAFGIVPLESCICGQHYYCPDGWHDNDELPCVCTADCVIGTDLCSCGVCDACEAAGRTG